MENNKKIKNFTDLEVWQEAHTLVLWVYRLTRSFPKEEVFGLTSQMRRAAVSITSNIAEGFSRHSYKEKALFYSMARGSLTELQNQLLIAKDAEYVSKGDFSAIANQSVAVHKLLNAFIRIAKSLNFKSRILLDSRFQIPDSISGAATLPTIIVLAILILIVGAGITASALSESFISLGQKKSSEALIFAEAGARDAFVRIARDKKYACATTDCYQIDFVSGGCASGDGCAKISVSSGVGSDADPKVVTSKGISGSSVRELQVSVILDASLYGRIATTTWQEL
ncbi:MAG: four helix bundle protein [Parcubacteria group bacterium]|nr:four helix bundle protein [Parcubacteria group bacterium]